MPPLQNSTIVTPTIILAILKLIYYFHGQKLISSNTVLRVVLQYALEQSFLLGRKAQSLPEFKSKISLCLLQQHSHL